MAVIPTDTIESRVALLDAHTVNQIAAGEVVERPASVVKELVENALDAGAQRIIVELKGAGRDLIRVTDDGHGILEPDLLVALQRHATSKIRSLRDLQEAVSLGFRGEALPSIASVSRMTLASGTGDGVRRRVTVEGGEIGPVIAEPGPRGTVMTVEDLFFNTPARLKFLKSDATELSQCYEIVQRLAIAAPHVAFQVVHGDSIVLRTAGDGDLLGAIAEVWGRDAARALAPTDHFETGARVRGFVSPPHFTKPTRANQWFFVNGRPIRSRSLQTAVDIAFRSLTPERRYPLIALMLDIDPSRVDTNVSPTKTEVKFQQESLVFDAVRHAIKQALLEYGMIPDAAGIVQANLALQEARGDVAGAPALWGGGHLLSSPELLGGGSLGADHGAWSMVASVNSLGDSGALPRAESETAAPHDRAYEGLLDGLRIIGQSMNTFILAENREGLLIVDQHVAHERIIYERLRNSHGRNVVETQPLLVPQTLDLDRRELAVVRERMEEFAAVGYQLEDFGDGSVLVRAVPAAIRRQDPMKVLRDVISQVAGGEVGGCITPARESIWIMASCKMAVKAGDPLSHAEMEKLMLDLAATENPYLCPHGRPITLVLKRGDLLRKFKR
jgi:DNA mismatch repair protein MutL